MTCAAVWAQFGWLQQPIRNDVLMRSGVVWDTLDEARTRTPHIFALRKEREMLELMTYDEVVGYAKSAASQTQDAYTIELYETIQTTVAHHEECIAQFEPRNDDETDQQRRRRRQNTFAPELPQGFAAQHGGLAALRNRMKTLA